MKPSIKSLGLGLFVAALALPAIASASTTSAKTLLSGASAKAAKEKKNVMVIFHASWCGWCHKLDDMLESRQFKSTFEKSYVITHIDVMEHDEKKVLENEGGEDLMTQLGATPKDGIPFFVMLKPDGTKIGDSRLPNKANMGYPSEPQEVTAFMALLKKSAPKMSAEDQSTIETFLRNPKKS